MKISDITKYLPIGSLINYVNKHPKEPFGDVTKKEVRKEMLKFYGHFLYALIPSLILWSEVISPQISKGINKLISQSTIPHSYSMVRTYSDTNKNNLYDTLETKTYSDGKLNYAKITEMGKECTKAEVEKITADRTPYETIEFK